MSNTSVTYSLYLNSNVRQNLIQTERAALSLDGTMSKLSKTVHHLGFGFVAANAFGFLKSGIEDAAKYQDAINRIKFASENLKEGFKNMAFIRQEAIDLKIPLQQTTDAYGKFLAMVQGSGMAGQKVRELHDNLLVIGKIKHLDASLMDAGVLNLGKMLEAGGLDARHLRPLEQQLSGIGAFLAKEVGTNIQGLRRMIHDGEAATIDPQLLVNAIKKQAESLRQHLPEALESLQSHITDTQNAWVEFKNTLVLEYSDDIVSFLHSLRDLIKYISDNREGLKKFGEAIVFIGKAYLLYKVSLTAVNTVKGIYQGLEKAALGNVSSVISSNTAKARSYDAQAVSVSNLVKEIQALNFVTNGGGTAYIGNSLGNMLPNTRGNRYSLSQNPNFGGFSSYGNRRDIINATNSARATMSAGTHRGDWMESMNRQNMRYAAGAANRAISSGISNIGNAAAGLFAGAMPVAVTMLTVAAAAQIASAVSQANSYRQGTPDERLEMSKNEILGQIKDFNSVFGRFANFHSPSHYINGGGTDAISGMPKSLEALKKLDPSVIYDADFVKKVRYQLDVYKDLSLINLAKNLGYLLPEERNSGIPFVKTNRLPGIWGIPGGGFGQSTTSGASGDEKIFNEDLKEPSSAEHHGIGKASSIRGNSITTINIDIGEMIGLKNPSFSVKSSSDMKDIEKTIGDVVVKMLTQAVNDSQLIGKSH